MNPKLFLFHVDHGFCALIRSPNGMGLLIDCGARPGFSPIRYIANNIPLIPYKNTWKECPLALPLVNLVSTSWRDQHVDNRYSSEDYAGGIKLEEGIRRMFTTRRDGTIQVEIKSDGTRVWEWDHLDDNV